MAADDDSSYTYGWLWTLLIFLAIFGVVYYFFINKTATGIQQGGSLGQLLKESGRTMRYR